MIGAFIVAWMKQESGVTALIGSGNNCRIFPQVSPQNTAFPRITYQVFGDATGMSLTGPISLADCTVQIDCWGGRGPGGYAAAQALADAIEGTETNRKLNGYSGTLGGVEVRSCILPRGGRSDGVLFPTDGSDDAILSVSMDFEIAYKKG